MLKIYTRLRYVVIFVCSGLLWQGCNIINPPEPVPTYIHIDSFNFVRNPLLPSITLSHQITSVWVYYNNNPVGVFDMPVTFPVITSGTGQLECFPVIAVDGQNSLIGQYLYYQTDTFTFSSQPGKIINHECITSYYSDVKDTILSNFEFGLTKFYLDGGNIPMTLVSKLVPSDDTMVFEGEASGSIYMTNPGVDSSIDSTASFYIPPGAAFIEFNYKCDVPFYVGLQSNAGANISLISTAPYYIAGIFPSATWQKFYLKLSDYTSEYPGDSYNFYIKASLPIDQPHGRVLLDNIQLIKF